MRTDDGSIIYECLNGEPGAFGVLVDKYKEGIYAYVYDKLRDFRDAQDVTQEVFLQAYRGLRSLRRWESFSFWLYCIASARCKLWIRTQSRRVDQDFIADQDPKVLEAFSVDSYRDSQLSESVREALDSLPDTYREVLILYYFAGMNSVDIARALGTSPTAIRHRLSRARARLKEEMIAMMGTTFESQRLPSGFTFRIVEAVKRIKIHPMPRTAGLPWGLSLAVGIIVTVLSLNPDISITRDMAIPTGSPLPVETRVLKTGEIPVDILKTSEISIISSKQGNGNGGEPQKSQNTVFLAPQQGEGGMWTKKTDMQTSRYFYSTCTVNGKIYAIGGIPKHDNDSPVLKTVERYDPETNTWVYVSDMPSSRWSFSASSVEGDIYIIAGAKERPDDGFPIWPVLEYDTVADRWVEKGKPPVRFFSHCSAAVKGRIYVMGGINNNLKAVSGVYEYDPRTDIWTQKADMPTARFAAAAAVVKEKIYIVGGATPNWIWSGQECHELSTLEEYDPTTDTWTKRTPMLTARSGLSSCVLGGKIYAIGGAVGRTAVNKVEEYDPETGMWETMADMPTKRLLTSSGVANDRIYTIGGWDGAAWGRVYSTVEEYTPEGWPFSVSPHSKLPTKWGDVKSD
jgi:RNA polymerase sigma factor (sigma-70 family)